MPDMARRVADFGTTVFAEITALARECGAINLGQGYPDFDGPPPVLQAAIDAVNKGMNQYPPGIGFPQVREAVAGHARRFYGQIVDPASEVLITAGATEAIFAAILGLTDPGDEVIVFAPTYDSYVPNMTMAGVSPRIVYMNPPDWSIDPDELAAAFTPRTRALIINTPHNPTGKVYSRDELLLIAELCQRHDVIAITDEVYEHLIYDGSLHTRLATLPGMAERTLTISSLGKTFSVTGWKVGWAIGPRELVTGVNRAHQFITYAVASPLQAATAAALALPDAYYAALRDDFQARRDFMLTALEEAGFRTLKPQGGYFILAEWQGIPPEGAHIETDEQFARWLTCEAGVAAIPPSAFYAPSEKHRVRHLIRFAACKKDETLRAAADKLDALRHAR
jgi:N-succinyldiaminopimelate aminotransferase